jgi:hypothetical protein
MENLNVVFKTIKECCSEDGIPDKTCLRTLQRMEKYNEIFLPVYTYLDILEHLGLIRFNIRTKKIVLTKEGQEAMSVFDHLQSRQSEMTTKK